MLVNPTISNSSDFLELLRFGARITPGQRTEVSLKDSGLRSHELLGELRRFAVSAEANFRIAASSTDAELFAAYLFTNVLRDLVGTGDRGHFLGGFAADVGWHYELEMPPAFAVSVGAIEPGSIKMPDIKILVAKNKILSILAGVLMVQQIVMNTPGVVAAAEEIQQLVVERVQEASQTLGALATIGLFDMDPTNSDTLAAQLADIIKKRDEDGWTDNPVRKLPKRPRR